MEQIPVSEANDEWQLPSRSFSVYSRLNMEKLRSSLGKDLSLDQSPRGSSLVSLEGSSSERGIKLPQLKLRKVMKKIGAAHKGGPSFVPTNEERLAFRKAK